VLLPQTRSQLSDSAGGVNADPLQHIDQVGIGVDTMQAARDDQTLHDADMLGTELGPTEQPVLAVIELLP
jgi:hypothetical protein